MKLQVGVPYAGSYKEILNTDDVKFGGTGVVNSRVKKAAAKEWDDKPYSININLAPLSVSILSYIPETANETKKKPDGKAWASAKQGAKKKKAAKA